jgi:phospholipid N-methyltransferase
VKSKLFFLQYLIDPRKVGAVLPSSTYLAEQMVDNVDFTSARYIVEYGPGTGVFTDEILKKRTSDTTVMLIENNEDFYLLMKEKCKDEKNVIIIYGSAEDIDLYAKQYGFPYIDYVISGLPFASLPKKVSNVILNKTKGMLKSNGRFITFQYTLLKKDIFNSFFNRINVSWEYRNFPPAYVLSCQI